MRLGNNNFAKQIACALTIVLGAMLFLPAAATAATANTAMAVESPGSAANNDAPTSDPSQIPGLSISADNSTASLANADFAIEMFSRSNKGTARAYQDVDYGYRYPLAAKNAFATLALDDAILVYIPRQATQNPGFDFTNKTQQQDFESLLSALDSANSNGGETLVNIDLPFIYTSELVYRHGDFTYSFAFELEDGYYYVSIQERLDGEPDAGFEGGASTGPDTDLNTDSNAGMNTALNTDHNTDPARAARLCDTGVLINPEDAIITATPEGFDALAEFLTGMDYRPFWVSLRTSLVAMIFVFVLGLAAARFSLGMNKRVQDILDAVFTIPMVLPPTVCGFLLLVLFGNSTPVGQWLIAHGIELVFSWPAAVVAAIVVAFPLMYRTSRGAFEAQDADMLDAARTLGWKEARIFFRLTLPLAWPSIAAGTVLSFARAMGEFGATLFVAGNYAGVTQTMPIAIYFQWMSDRADVAVFWVFVVVLISFIVILFINLYASHTQRYRKGVPDTTVIKEGIAKPEHQIPEEF